MYAIVTKYLGATESRPSRILAKSGPDRLTVHWDHAIGVGENHEAAARALLSKMLKEFGGVVTEYRRVSETFPCHAWSLDSQPMRLVRAETGPGASGYVFVETPV